MNDIFEALSSLLFLGVSFSSAATLLHTYENPQLPTRLIAMACSPSQTFAYDDDANLTFAEIHSSEDSVASYSNLALPDPTSLITTPALGWEVDGTIDFAYNGDANLALAEISSFEDSIASNIDLTLTNPDSSIATLAGGWEVDGTIDPALLTQRYVSSDS